jgi:SWIM zinc finger
MSAAVADDVRRRRDGAADNSRWTTEQVLALAPRPTVIASAQGLAVPTRWAASGCDRRAVWGRCHGASAEPYEVAVDHRNAVTRCSCPARLRPCKHAIALLLLWSGGHVVEGVAPSGVVRWMAGLPTAPSPPLAESGPVPGGGGNAAPSEGAVRPPGRDQRVGRMIDGLVDLDRWLDDRLRIGLADPALARYATWDDLAARLVDAQAGGVANRVRRLAGEVGAGPRWHDRVLAEMGGLHLLAQAGRRLGQLPDGLADSVATAVGWQVRRRDVLAGVPDTDTWLVMGRSDRREDRIEVRRWWLRGVESGRWAMLLSFAAYRESLDDSLEVGSRFAADMYRYPGVHRLRAVLGIRHERPEPATPSHAGSVADACAAVGSMIAGEPWIERVPFCVRAAPALHAGRWVLTDDSGSMPVAGDAESLTWATLLACSGGSKVTLTCEWTADGVVPLTVHMADRAVDVGPRADPSFLAA